jgi:hypothetical protein
MKMIKESVVIKQNENLFFIEKPFFVNRQNDNEVFCKKGSIYYNGQKIEIENFDKLFNKIQCNKKQTLVVTIKLLTTDLINPFFFYNEKHKVKIQAKEKENIKPLFISSSSEFTKDNYSSEFTLETTDEEGRLKKCNLTCECFSIEIDVPIFMDEKQILCGNIDIYWIPSFKEIVAIQIFEDLMRPNTVELKCECPILQEADEKRPWNGFFYPVPYYGF